MFKNNCFSILLIICFILLNVKAMAQSVIKFSVHENSKTSIITLSESAMPAALILKRHLDKSFGNSIELNAKNNLNGTKIVLKIEKNIQKSIANEFTIKSDENTLYLIGFNEKTLRFAVYTLLESWGFRKYTATYTYIPKSKYFEFLKNTTQIHRPSFEFRALLYPDCYDEAFRDWHKLDWHIDDFGIWGHSFDKLVPPQIYFNSNPELFALYDGNRREESLCMTNDTVVAIIAKKMKAIIKETPEAQFYSVSQNDDAIYCECKKCNDLNTKHGGPQGSLYYFLNRIAKRFPDTKITTLAYLHTYKPPINLKIKANIYTIFCPIDLNRGKSIPLDQTSNGFRNTLQNWAIANPNLYLWDYTVQFSNYFSPFPNSQTFAENYKFFQHAKIKGIFAQGYADILGDFSELRQYLLAKLLWDANADSAAITNDFLRGFYGKAAPEVNKYLELLKQNQEKANTFLDIYSGPVQSRTTFLTVEQMDKYDILIQDALDKVKDDTALTNRVEKLRLSLEYAYFEQSKFYGADKHGMFITNKNNQKEVRKGLAERVKKFADDCKTYNIYELSEGGLSPNKYLLDWQHIAKNSAVTHLGEKMKVSFLSTPSPDYSGKSENGLTDGVRGYKDFNINWIGWYQNDAILELTTDFATFNQIKINFLEDQRHWIFLPRKVIIYGFKDGKYEFLNDKTGQILEEDYTVSVTSWEIYNENFKNYEKIKIIIENQADCPIWRKRKFKKPMIMLDEIEIYNK